MFDNIIIQAILSYIIIYITHTVYLFFKNLLTTPKVKDLVNNPRERYKKIYEDINKEIEPENKEKMKNELKNYLKDVRNKNKNNEIEVNKKEINNLENMNSYNNGGSLNYTPL
jgi:hypothetical protein